MLNIVGKSVLVVGGGNIGARKAMSLLESGAKVTCISPLFSKKLEEENRIELKKKIFEESDLEDFYLVVAATNDIEVNQYVHKRCQSMNILSQTVDSVNDSDFDFMATKRFKDLVLAVSTYGKAPNYSKDLIQVLSETITEEQLEVLQKEIKNRNQLLKSKKTKEEL